MSIRLYVGNLPKELDRLELQEVFAPEGESVTTKVITDRKTGKCRGFGFVTVLTDEQADQVIEKYNGLMFKENPLKIEKALPRSKGKSEKGEDDQQQSSSPASPQLVSASASTSPSLPVPAPQQQQRSAPPTQGGGGGSSKSNRRRGDNNKSRRNQSATTVSNADSGSVQPDPRWASALEELKQKLEAQAAS